MNRRGRCRVLELRFRQMRAEAAVVWGHRRINSLQESCRQYHSSRVAFVGIGAAVVRLWLW